MYGRSQPVKLLLVEVLVLQVARILMKLSVLNRRYLLSETAAVFSVQCSVLLLDVEVVSGVAAVLRQQVV